MATQDYPVVEITATLPEMGETTGRFELKKARVEPGIQTGLLVSEKFSQVSGAIGGLAGEGSRKGVSVDTGGGRHVNEVTIESLTGDDGQWGYSSDTSKLDQGTATAGDRIQKVQVFNRYLKYGSPDSFTPAKFEYGEYCSDGFMPEGALKVLLEDPSWTIPKDESSSFSGTIRFISTVDLANTAATATSRTG